jgi:hypothetical protein
MVCSVLAMDASAHRVAARPHRERHGKRTSKEVVVAIVHMQEYEIGDRSTENYDFVKKKLGDVPIEGLIVHTAGFDDDSGVWRQLDVWESREHADRFMVRVLAIVGDGPEAFPRPDTFAPPTREAYYELHDLKRG